MSRLDEKYFVSDVGGSMKQCTFHKKQSATIRERRRERNGKKKQGARSNSHNCKFLLASRTYYTRAFSGDVAPYASSFSLPTAGRNAYTKKKARAHIA
jgi:hypothetical protein